MGCTVCFDVVGIERTLSVDEMLPLLLLLPADLWPGQDEKEQGNLTGGRANEYGHRRSLATAAAFVFGSPRRRWKLLGGTPGSADVAS